MPSPVRKMSTYYEAKMAFLLKKIKDAGNYPEVESKKPDLFKKKIHGQRKTYLAPPPNVQRTAMGEYIVPDNGRPLTSLNFERPGPSSYKPSIELTHVTAPRYSIASAARKNINTNIPGPADYNIVGDLKWKHRSITLKGRYKDKVAARDRASPACYLPKGKATGDSGPKYTIALKGSVSGPPNILDPPTQMKGFKTPGPIYFPNFSYWGRGPEYHFGRIYPKSEREKRPGPSDYPLNDPDKGPAFTLRKKPMCAEWQMMLKRSNEPGPNAYAFDTVMGKGEAVSMKGRPLKGLKCDGASPASFFVKRNLKTNGAFMTYRSFDTVPESPGPAAYVSEAKPKKENISTFTCRQNCCPIFPKHPTHVIKINITEPPGPGAYNLSKDFDKNCNPAYTIGNRYKDLQVSGDGPGPSTYDSQKYKAVGSDFSPAYTIPKQIDWSHKNKNPGPSDYDPKLPSSGPRFTIASKIKPKPLAWPSPGPNAFDQSSIHAKCKCKLPVTFKGRATPWMYSGFPSRIC